MRSSEAGTIEALALLRLVLRGAMVVLPHYRTPVKECALCGGGLTRLRTIQATLIDLDGNHTVQQESLQCTSRGCRAAHHYNFAWSDKKKWNTIRMSEVDALFVNPKLGFTKALLEYHDALQFRGFLSTKALVWAGKTVLYDDQVIDTVSRAYGGARRLFLVLQEFEDMWTSKGKGDVDKLFSIEVDNPITPTTLQEYDTWLHAACFPPVKPRAVTAFCGRRAS